MKIKRKICLNCKTTYGFLYAKLNSHGYCEKEECKKACVKPWIS